MELYLSLSAYGGVSTRTALEVFWHAGIRCVELAIGPRPDNDAAQAIEDFRQVGMIYRAHHAFVWSDRHQSFNLAEPQNWDYFQRLTDWLATLGITAYSVHGGHFSRNTERTKTYANFLENANFLAELCLAKGIVLGVETMYPTLPNAGKKYLLDNATEISQFCQDLPGIKLVVDLSHLHIWRDDSISTKLQLLKLPLERLLEIHISDNDGRQDIHSRITPETWWLSHIAEFPTGVPIVLESRLNHLPIFTVKQEYVEIQNLLLNHNIRI